MTRGSRRQTKSHSLTYYLNRLYDMQQTIWLVYRPTSSDTWSDRCQFMGEGYQATKPYNHRSVLKDEIIIEFDYDKKSINRELIYKVADRLKKDNINYSIWYSGNKSYHAHLFVNMKTVKNYQLLKRRIVQHYCKGIGKPDMRLTAKNHLIRAERGVHEKTGLEKSLITTHGEYPEYSRLPQEVWDDYVNAEKISVGVRTSNQLSGIENHKAFKYIIKSHKFKEAGDGHERALFMLIHVLKPKYKEDKEGLIKFLQEWYRYSSGYKLSDKDIKNKVNYHWNRKYRIGITYLRDLLISIGKEDLLEESK